MKRMITLLFAVISINVSADTWKDPNTGITWTYTISNGKASVGGGFSDLPAVSKLATGAITIPSILGGCPVTSIGKYAFYGCSGLTSITIPSSVTSIGVWAFYNCSGLTSITIPSGVTSISYAFYGCSGLTSVTIPSSVKSIEVGAFSGCSSLTAFAVDFGNPNYCSINGLLCSKDGKTVIAGINGNVTIPEGVTSIVSGAFYGCSGLTSVTIPEGVTSIGASAFYCCIGLTSVTIPSSVTSIWNDAFYGCSGLSSVTIPSSVTSIESYAFYGCSGLTSVTILEGVTSIGSSAFEGCSSLTSVTIPSSVTSIGSYAFSNCSGLEEVHVNDIAAWCKISFYYSFDNPLYYAHRLYLGDKVVTDLVIPEGVTSIGDDAFYGCRGLTSVTIPSSVTSIGSSAFSHCSGIESVTIPDSVTSIGNEAFYYCIGLKEVHISDIAAWCKISFGSYFANPLNYAHRLYLGDKEATDLVIPEGVTSIGDDAFYGCRGLTSVTIPSSVTSIGDGAFYGCSGLSSVTIPACVTRLSNTFPDVYTKIKELVICDGVTSIESPMFSGCSGLTSVTIPSSVTSIGVAAFSGCRGLTSVTIPSSVTSIGDQAFYGCWSLTSVSIPNGVENIGAWAFGDCESLRAICLPSNLKCISDKLFYDCFSLEFVLIPPGPTSIGNGAFTACSSLSSIVIPASVAHIGEDAFYQCDPRVVFTDYGNTDRLLYLLAEGGCGWRDEDGDYILPTWITIYETYLFAIYFNAAGGQVDKELMNWAYGLDYAGSCVFDAGKLPYPIRDGYEFLGWFTAIDGGDWIESAFSCSCEETGEMDVYAHWQIIDWNILYENTKEMVNINPITYTVDDAIEFAALPEPTGWNFVGWSPTSIAKGSTGDKIITANWERETYVLTFDAGEGSVLPMTKDVQYGLAIGELPSPEKHGYDFVGWFTEKDGGEEITSNTIVESDATYYAHWIKHVYTVSLDTNGGECDIGSVSVAYQSAIGELPIPDRGGYIFAGWFTEKECGEEITSETIIESDVTYYAHWTPINYFISYFNLRGMNNPNPSTYTILDEITFSPLADAEGWIFKRWDPSKINSGTIGAMEIEAQWQRVTNTVSYVVGELGTIKSGDEEQLIEYDEVSTPPEVEAVPGWRFVGWDSDTSIGIKVKSTFVAQYEPIEYAITYANDRGMNNPNPSTYTILDAITFLPLSEKSGLRFVGWDKPSIALGSIGDITVTASWEECELQDIVNVPSDSISFGGDADWLLVYVDGKWTMRSGRIAKSQSSYCDIKFTGPAKVSFSLKVSCEAQDGEDMTDGMELLVDGESVLYISGITNWEDKYIDVLGEGEHTVRWCYSKDNKTDEGDDCCYVSDVVVTPIYNIAFTDGGADGGEAPIALNVWKDGEYELPDCGTLYKAKYAFIGWKLGEVVYPVGTKLTATESVEFIAVWEAKLLPMPIVEVAEYYTTEKTLVTIDYGVDGVTGYYKLDGGEPIIYEGPFEIEGTHTLIAYAIHEDYFDSAVTKEYTSVRAPWTIGECLNYDGTFGDTTWVRDLEVTHDGKAAMRSGITANKESSQLTMTINGSARVSFWVKTSSEYDDYDGEVYDGFVCYIDGVAQNEKLIGGEIDWQELSFDVVGAGEHTLTLSYEKDKSGSGGEDCVWIDEVKIASVYDILFKCEDMDMGEPPQSLARRSGEKFELPNCGTLKKMKYAFAGWKLGGVIYTPGTVFTVIEPMEFTAVWEAKLLPMPIVEVAEYYTTETTTVTINYGVDGVTGYYKLDGGEPIVYDGPFEIEGTHAIVAYATHEDYFDSAITKEYRSVRAPWTICECLNYDGVFGDTTWVRDLEVTHDGKAAMRSGITGNKESSQLTLSVSGSGMLTFWCKTSSEYDIDDGTVYDGMAVYVDGVAQNSDLIGGDTNWTRYDFEVVGEGEHTIVWSYEKDKGGSDGEDCVWIDEVVWEPKMAGGAVIGDVTALKEVFGEKSSVVRNLTSEEELVKFNEFLGKCGITAASQISDKQKEYAYESFRMSAITVEPRLFENEPKLKIHEFKQGEGGWSVSISLKAGGEEIAMAKRALEEHISVGNKLTEITSKPDIVASPSADGASLSFTIAPPEGKQAFIMVRL